MSSARQPRVLALVLNGVVEDSRVLKCAYSAGEAGWDCLVLGATRDGSKNQFEVGRARVLRIPIKAPVGTGLLAKVLRKLRYIYQKYSTIFFGEDVLPVPGLARAIEIALPYALAFKPDVIHAHDYTALPVADALANSLQEALGQRPKVIYDAHEFLQGTQHLTPQSHHSFSKAELDCAKRIDGLVVVSHQMVPMMEEYLKTSIKAVVVANDPLSEGRRESSRTLRADSGIPPNVPILVYSGAVAPQRGLDTVVEALVDLEGVALVIIAVPGNVHVKTLLSKAAGLGIADRVKAVPYVPNEELVSYLSGADIGMIPIWHRPNHEISLITKFGEYGAANLPIIVSDVKTMAAEVRAIGNGEVFSAGSVEELVAAIKLVLADPSKYRAAYTPEVLRTRSWERQSETLIATYELLVQDLDHRTLLSPALPFALTPVRPLAGPTEIDR